MSDAPPPPNARTTAIGAGLLATASFVFNWPYLFGGFHADDLIFLEVMRQRPLPFPRWKGLWTIEDISAFDFWWAEPEAHTQFWRPLPSLLFEASLKLFGENAFPLHLLSVLLHGAVAATLFLIVVRLSRRTILALLTGALYVACEDHSLSVGWIATMTDLACVLFLHLATLSHLGWLERRRPSALLASLVSTVAAMACKESAVVIAPILLWLGWALPEGRVIGPARIAYGGLAERTRRLLRDPWIWAPQLVLMALYVGIYRGCKPAQMTNLMYANPLVDPLAYLSHLVLHLPVVWLATLSPIPPSLTMFLPSTLAPLALLGALAFSIWLAVLWPWRDKPMVVWAFGAYILSTLPQMGADASERLLYYPFTFAALLLAMCTLRVRALARRFAPDQDPAPRAIRWFGVYVLSSVFLPGVLLSAFMPFSFRESLASPELQTLTALPTIQDRKADRILFLNTPGMFSSFYVTAVLDYHLDRPIHPRILSSCNALVTLERVGAHAFVLRVDRAGWLSNMFARAVRVTPTITPGATYEKDMVTATILEVTADGSDALAVRFDVHPTPDGQWPLLMRWDGKQFVAFDLGAQPEGQRQVLADTSDVWASM